MAATIFDKSTETIQPNNWQTFVPSRRTLPRVFYSQTTGTNGSSGYGLVVRHMAATKSTTSNAAIYGATAPAEDFDLAESVSLAEAADQGVVVAYGVQRKSDLTGSVAGVNGSAPAIRTDFASTVAWEPFLRADENGEVTFRFTTADKLSFIFSQSILM